MGIAKSLKQLTIKMEQKRRSERDSNGNSVGNVAGDIVAGGTGVGLMVGAKSLVGTTVVPALMSSTGTVVAGTGTMHTVLTASLQSWAFGPIGPITVGVGAGLG